ncbi:hypothetical protein FNV43_RR01642 [Rhamnella rubrinervis]|uniref:Non-specific serine/threonine protein kinase n=1 Tax=Rhamnella rubrinervis TaxID=2594499 RepID=A0A8K0HQU4_9ROSA|nr:hypothetical protein FNV43_RR01642 [Rhamnella rubrinervis]
MMKSNSYQTTGIIVYLIIFICCRGIYVSCSPNVCTTTSAFKCLPDQSTTLIMMKLGFYTISELPKFQILALASYNLSEFPSFLKTQDQLEQLDLPNGRIEGLIPKWFWAIANKKLDILDLSGNTLQGSLNVPPLLTSFLDISETFIHNWTYLKVLDMSKNHFSGTIPQWLGNFGSTLETLNLQGNKFHRSLSNMFTNESMLHLKKLDLSHNQLQGKVPQFLINCSLCCSDSGMGIGYWYVSNSLIQFQNLGYGDTTHKIQNLDTGTGIL